MAQQKTRREKKNANFPHINAKKKPETQLNQHNLANLTSVMTNV